MIQWSKKDPHAWAKMLAMLSSGSTVKDVADNTGIPGQTIWSHVINYGRNVKYNPSLAGIRRGSWRYENQSKWPEVVRLLDDGLTYKEIMKATGVPYKPLAAHVKKHGRKIVGKDSELAQPLTIFGGIK